MFRLDFDWWRWLVITAFACLAISMFCRCTTTKYVPMVQYKEKVVNQTDTFVNVDSVWLHDSVFVFKNGDTIFKDRWHYRDRYKYLYKNHTDTIIVVDSIPYKVYVTKKDTGGSTTGKLIGLLMVLIAFVAALFVYMYWKKR